jgi:hypothetical protein
MIRRSSAAATYITSTLSSTTSLTYTAAVANSGTNVAHAFDNSVALSGTTKIASFRNAGTEKAAVEDDGFITVASGGGFSTSAAQGLILRGNMASNSTSSCVRAFNANSINATGRILIVCSDTSGATETWGVTKDGKMVMQTTDSSGTPGNVTINKPSGKAAIASGASTVTVTNSLVTASSIVLIQPQNLDGSLLDYEVVPAAGSFTVTGNSAAAENWPFGFVVFNA